MMALGSSCYAYWHTALVHDELFYVVTKVSGFIAPAIGPDPMCNISLLLLIVILVDYLCYLKFHALPGNSLSLFNLEKEDGLVNLSIARTRRSYFTYCGVPRTFLFLGISSVQHECMPQAILRMNVICQATSGMGKTAVFVLSTLQQIDPVAGYVSAFILCHTRELAYQAQDQ